MDNNDNWLNQNPSDKKQPEISSIPEINSIPHIPGYEKKSPNAESTPESFGNQQNATSQATNNSQQDSFSYSNKVANPIQNSGYSQTNYNVSSKSASYSGIKLNIPNSGGILSLGILSILSFCCCGGFLAPILSIIALVMASSSMKAYKQNPDYYTISSLNNIKAGKVTAIIGLVISGLFFLYILFVYTIGSLNMNDINEVINESWNGKGY